MTVSRDRALQLVGRATIIMFGLLLIPATAVVTAAVKQRFADGPNQVFSGGPLEAGELYTGPEPDWSVVADVPTIEMQLLDPPRSRRIWTVVGRRRSRLSRSISPMRRDGQRIDVTCRC